MPPGRDPRTPQADVRTRLVYIATAEDPGAPSSSHSLDEIDEVYFHRGERSAERRVIGGRRVLVLAMPDPCVSRDHGRLLRDGKRWVLDDPSSKNGVVVDGALVRSVALHDRALLEFGHSFWRLRHTDKDGTLPAYLTGDATIRDLPRWPRGLATFTPGLACDIEALTRVAPTEIPVVLLGETGTGKEVVARALHELSLRSGPFVPVNCGAIPSSLIEAELFGHRRGGFTGAQSDRPGLMRSADRGTLFLDEIGELPLVAQPVFLRALQEQEVIPIGDDRPIKIDVRLCAATLCDLEAAVATGRFRDDLYGRIVGYVMKLPLLRDRLDDVGLLLADLRQRIPGAREIQFAPAALRNLLRYHWPRNIRELEKALALSVTLATRGVIEVDHLPAQIRQACHPVPPAAALVPEPLPVELDDNDRALRERLVELLRIHKGNVAAVSEAMGKLRPQIYRWIERFDIDLDSFRGRP